MIMFPDNDSSFEELKIDKVDVCEGGWTIQRSDGFSIFVPDSLSLAPIVGSTARFYGKGLGFQVRGIFIDGNKAFYRTEEEEKEKHNIYCYGKDAKDWLERWDGGETVWSIEMGGMGPGYEQAIQVTVAEVLRHLIDKEYDHSSWSDEDKAKDDGEKIRKASFDNEVIDGLGLSGAQYGAALQVATKLYMDGPIGVMTNEQIADRHIQVSKNFP